MRHQPKPPKVYRRILISAPGAAPLSLWATVESLKDKDCIVKLVLVQGVEPAAGWHVEIEGVEFSVVKVQPDGALCCEAI